MDKKRLIDILLLIEKDGIPGPQLPPGVDPLSSVAKCMMFEMKIKRELWKLLKAYLLTESDLQIFNGKMMMIGSGCSRVTIPMLEKWLLARTLEKGAEKAAEELENYIGLDATPGYEIVAIAGIDIRNPILLSKEISLIPIDMIPSSVIKESLLNPFEFSPIRPSHHPTAALICKTSFSPKTINTNESDKFVHSYKSKISMLQEICCYLTLVGPSAPLPVTYWCMPEEWVPCTYFIGSGSTSPSHELSTDYCYPYKESDLKQANDIYSIYSSISTNMKEKIRIPLERLNQAMRRKQVEDKAIDLGIALEALLADDRTHNDPISLTLRLRGAWLLGKNAEERQNLFIEFRELYNCRSIAAHGGKLDKIIAIGMNKVPTEQFIINGFKLCAEAIEIIISNGELPKWDELIFGY